MSSRNPTSPEGSTGIRSSRMTTAPTEIQEALRSGEVPSCGWAVFPEVAFEAGSRVSAFS
jgi:hypothetical protein